MVVNVDVNVDVDDPLPTINHQPSTSPSPPIPSTWATIPPVAGLNIKDGGKSGWIRAVIAWTGSIALLAYLALTTDLDAAWKAFLMADQYLFLGTLLVVNMVVFFADVGTVRLLLQMAGFRVGYGEFARIKGASYLMNVLNYNLALAMMAALVSRRSDKGLAASGSPFILLNFIDLSALSILVLLGLAAGAVPFEDGRAMLAVVVMASGGLLGGPTLCLLSRLKISWLGRFAQHEIMSAFRMLDVKSYVLMSVLRVGFVSIYAVMAWLFMHAFRFDIPFTDLLVYQPILGLIVFIPISVSGLGSTQVVMRSFFEQYAPIGIDPVAAIDAYSTSTIVAVLLMRVVIGLLCMPYVSRALKAREE